MNGQWLHKPERNLWVLVLYDRVEMSISGAMLDALCARLELRRDQALAWIATRPQQPYRRVA